MKPSDSEIQILAERIQSLFIIPEIDAIEAAQGILTLAYGWGSPPADHKLDAKIKRDLSKKYSWHSNTEKEVFEKAEAIRLAEQNIFITKSKNRQYPRF